MLIKILPNDNATPVGKLADVELHFGDGEPLAGMKLIGFNVWERRGGGGLNVTFPARQYAVNGERRSFALLRPIAFDSGHSLTSAGQDRIRALIVEAYRAHEAGERASQPAADSSPDVRF